MKNFVKGLITNRFGIVLAALNVCHFLSHDNFYSTFDKIMVVVNFPAVLLGLVSSQFIRILINDFPLYTKGSILTVLMIFFVTLQWLFIGWLAKIVAEKIRSMKG